MDPNEYQEHESFADKENAETVPSGSDTAAQETQPFPVTDGAYHGAGAGQKESPYANSPYYSYRESSFAGSGSGIPDNQQPPHSDAGFTAPPVKEKPPRKPMGKGFRRVIAAAIALVLVAGSCAVTAWSMNLRWEAKNAEFEQSMQEQIAALEEKIDKTGSSGSNIVISGSPVSSGDYLTPSQVYAMNVNSVVAITCSVTYSGGWGNTTQTATSSGSGFVLTQDGYVVTNYHVVEGTSQISVTTYMGDEYEAQLVGYDELNDVALLKVESSGLKAVTIGSSDELMVGDQVVAIGNPLGELTSTQTVGYVSGKDRSVSTDGSIINMLQTDAAINAGNSGGPLFNMKGEVVGITTAKYSGSTSSGASIEGIGFAIPIDDVIGMIDDLRNYGYLKNQAYLGVMVRDLDSSTASMYSLPSGSYVESVEEGGSADRAGVQPKDIIIGIGEYTVSGNAELTSALRKFSAGDSSTITVYRSGQELVLDITFDERPQDTSASTDPTESGEMPDSGDYNEWYNYFFGPNAGGSNGNG